MFALIALLLFGGAHTNVPQIDSLGIKAGAETKWYSYTNKEAGFYFGEVHGMNRAPYQGWTVFGDPVLKDYAVSVDGKELDRADSRVTVYPDRLVRKYKSGITETFTLLDEFDAFVVQLSAPKVSTFDFRLLFNSASAKDFLISGAWAGVFQNTSVPVGNYGRWVAVAGLRHKVIRESSKVGPFVSPAIFQMKGKDVSIIVACARTEINAEYAAVGLMRKHEEFQGDRKKRMQAVLNRSFIHTGNERIDKAIAWAKLSLDALITNQGMKGIWAGLPWFDDYWGRDTFVSLPAAALWSGDFGTARKILLDFAARQDTDSASTNFGRIPNLITPKETIYNTADGTPRFVFDVFLYYSMTGDRDFLFEIYPAVKRAFIGTVKYHMDKNLFLIHGNQETWMDAVGPNGPYTPRGNRAVDVEALWLQQLLATRFLSSYVGDTDTHAATTEMAKRLIFNFNKKFVDEKTGYLYDHLDSNGVPDTTLRPNQLFASWAVSSREVRDDILRTVVEKLTYPWGVASLYQGDPNFHPFHHDAPYYPPDAAYHNGTVWVWLTGQLVSDLTDEMEQDFAFRSTKFLADEILDGKAAGTLPELFDAFPREGEKTPDESGAFSQAWSLAEFIQSFYRDYFGVQMDVPQGGVTLNPRLPDSIPHVTFRLNGGNNNNYVIAYRFDKDPKEIEIAPADSVRGTIFRIFFMKSKTEQLRTSFYLQGKDTVLLKFPGDTVTAEKNGKPFQINSLAANIPHDSTLDHLRFETPKVNLDWKFTKEAAFKILGSGDIKKADPGATMLASVSDTSVGDTGPNGKYVYPLNQNFKPGILDLTHADVSYDSHNVYFKLKFKNLVNPMWHPEYGFQLTFAAIAIGDGRGGQRNLGKNSNYTLPNGWGYQKVIYVGGGIEVFDRAGKKIAAYVPAMGDTVNTLGDVESKEITFSLPVDIVGRPSKDWRISVVVGAQDDHGGGGVGEFRTVADKATEWQGGGKDKKSMPNIYEALFLK